MDNELAVLTGDFGIDDRVLGDFVEIIGVVRGVLVAPLDFAVVWTDGEDARCPFIVTRPVFGVPVRPGITNPLVERVGFRIVGRGLPHRGATMLPAVLAVFPGLVAGFAGARDGVGAPGRLAGVEIGCLDEAADAEFATGGAHDGEIADDERRYGQRLADGGIRDFALPDRFASRLVDR